MEPTLGLLTTSGGTTTCSFSNDQLLTSRIMEKVFMGVSKENLVKYPNESDELELGLGLSLGNGKSAWGEHGRILTAKDFPNGFKSRVNTFSGTKRAADTSAQVGSPPSNSASQIVGWPPIRTYRMNNLVTQAKVPNVEEGKKVGKNEKEENNSKKKSNHGNHNEDAGRLGFVKVNVDGLPIGRKVDVSAYSCYQSLAKTLEDMFFKSSATISSTGSGKGHVKKQSKLLDGSSEFVLTYEDKEEDWMLVGDVPWEMFVNTVRRLRIMKTSEANGLAPRSQENGVKQKGKRI
ncbi:hypothetical protein LIER_14767 [Lithospermum erythrorhizon]|uniref:Auxin-responsive protein n=1 Tax=Lithospermum erythrorhizon TaxID=34254 RepID=A0AAV3Q1X6_LITER